VSQGILDAKVVRTTRGEVALELHHLGARDVVGHQDRALAIAA